MTFPTLMSMVVVLLVCSALSEITEVPITNSSIVLELLGALPNSTATTTASTKLTTQTSTETPTTKPTSRIIMVKPKYKSFSTGSFIGGMILSASLIFAGFVAFAFYKKRSATYNRMT
ncbi:hypothetical protein SNEBB_000047 [Seison nebaliae]|nr:hypothetical protein SNEBB_000047 [Seison nebaliae]